MSVESELEEKMDCLAVLQDTYRYFPTFVEDAMTELWGFKCTSIHKDIADFMSKGIQLSMVQAQRSQAKSTLAALLCVWTWIFNPKCRVLIISAGEDVAGQIANLVKQIVENWDILAVLRADRGKDRTSALAYDIHWLLKGIEKSPSLSAMGITGNLQGRRADLLIADDIESSKNSATQLMRSQLEHLTKDFTSICQNGQVLYLGTPQSSDSIYRSLKQRGYTIRIYPGRYPTREQEALYEGNLAPLLIRRMKENKRLRTGGGLDGMMGQPIDPDFITEDMLIQKQLEQGDSYFQLQFMLNTELSDKLRFPLKARNLIVMDVLKNKAPGDISWLPAPNNRVFEGKDLYRPFNMSEEMFAYEGKMMFIDPAGTGGDETVCTVSYLLHGYVFIPKMLTVQGGYSPRVFQEIAETACDYGVQFIEIEENMDKGSFGIMLRPVLATECKSRGMKLIHVEGMIETTNKQKRIIDTLEPIMGKHKLVIDPQVFLDNDDDILKYPAAERKNYDLLFQMTHSTFQRNCLVHDDKIDSLCGAVRKWLQRLAVDSKERVAKKRTSEWVKFADSLNKPEGNPMSKFKNFFNWFR